MIIVTYYMMKKYLFLFLCFFLLISQKTVDLYYIDWGTQHLFWELELVSDLVRLWEKDSGEKVYLKLIALKSFQDLIAEAKTWHKDDYKLSASSVTIKQERLESFDFSIPYFPVKKVIACLAETEINAFNWNKHPYRFAYLKGSTEEFYADLFKKTYSFKLVSCRDTSDKVDSLQKKKADIMISEGFDYVRNKKFRILSDNFEAQEYYGLLFAKNSTLKKVINKYLQRYLSSDAYYNLIKKHYNHEIAEDVQLLMKN